jgi:hypothetical protein
LEFAIPNHCMAVARVCQMKIKGGGLPHEWWALRRD